MALSQIQTHSPIEKNQELKNKPMHIWPTNICQGIQKYPIEKKTVSSISGVGKIGYHMKKGESRPLSYTTCEN